MPDGELRRVAVLSAIQLEYQAVRAHLINPRPETHPSGSAYERGIFTAYGQSWDVLIGETGIGNTKAAAETVRVIEYFKPISIIFVGVAGGLKDVKLGDVVAATKVYGYESGKADIIFRPRPDVRSSTHRMEQGARAEAKKRDWLQRLMEPLPDPASVPHAYIAPIASGNQVAASTDSALGDLLRSYYSDAVAVEMEGYGFLEALHAYPYIEALIIRGISDLIDDKSKADSNNFQEIAARHAAALAFEILAKLDTIGLRERDRDGNRAVSREGERQVVEVSQSTTASIEGLLQEFRAALPGYMGKIEKIRNFIDEGRDIFPDRYKSVIKSLESIDKHVQILCKHASELNFYHRAKLFAIRDQIHVLKSELRKFRLPFWFRRKSRQRRGDESIHESISAKCKALLANLEQF